MNESYFYNLLNNAGTLSIQDSALNFLVALVLALCIFLSYKISYTKLVYSARFNVSLVALTMITSLVMSCIGNNIALSLGMVGALSIVRFRTAVKDPRDTAYIFWAIAVGICCGVADYTVAAVGTGVIFVIVFIMGSVQSNGRYLLVIRADGMKTKEVMEAVDEYYLKKAVFRANNTNRRTDEVIYLLSEAVMKKAEKKREESFSEYIKKIGGIISVDIVSQNNEMNM